jgi:uncharacterized protein YcgL (UPF0745 family)
VSLLKRIFDRYVIRRDLFEDVPELLAVSFTRSGVPVFHLEVPRQKE